MTVATRYNAAGPPRLDQGTSDSALKQRLRAALSRLIPDTKIAFMVAADAGLPPDAINQSAGVELAWFSIIEAADRKPPCLPRLLEFVHERCPSDHELNDLREQICGSDCSPPPPTPMPVPPKVEQTSCTFIDTFSEYCDRCAEMMRGAMYQVRTVQTPMVVDAGSERPFRRYMDVTADKITRPHDGHPEGGVSVYKRLIAVDATCAESEEKKLRVFFAALREAARRAQAQGVEPDINCLQMSVVHRDTMACFFYSNLDVHITARRECALAFQLHRKPPPNQWQTCLYAKLEPNSSTDKLIQSYDQVWGQGEVVLGANFAAGQTGVDGAIDAMERETVAVLHRKAYGGAREPESLMIRQIIEKSAAFQNRFFDCARAGARRRSLAPLLLEWYAITRAFALRAPRYVATLAEECERAEPLRARQLEKALQIASAISAGEFGVGMPDTAEIHYRLFSRLAADRAHYVTEAYLQSNPRGTWEETRSVIDLFKDFFGDIHKGAGVLCTVERTAFHIVEAMNFLFPRDSSLYVELHLEIERGHAVAADRLCHNVCASSEDGVAVAEAAKEISDALGCFWIRMADEVFGPQPS